MKNKDRNLIFALSFLCAATGFLIPFWPLTVVGVVGAALFGQYIFAVVLGVLLDLAYGSPTGFLHYLFFPFTILSAASIVLRILGKKYLFRKAPQEHL